jgi:general secretion pathway protein G
MRYRLSTLMIALAIGPPLVAGSYLLRPQRTTCSPYDRARSTIAMLEDAVQFYALHVGQLPPDLNALLAPPANLAKPAQWKGPFLKNPPPLDPWGQPYRYEITDGIQSQYRVWSSGPDGRSLTEDDIRTQTNTGHAGTVE